MGDDTYFSERELGLPIQDKDEIGQLFWSGFVALVNRYIRNGSLAQEFPENCFDVRVSVGYDEQLLGKAFQAEIQSIAWPLNDWEIPDTLSVLNSVEFFCPYVSQPGQQTYHDFAKHFHLLSFDREAGLKNYRVDVNRLFRTSHLAYELQPDCKIHRLGPVVLRDILTNAAFKPEDQEVNRLLENTRIKIGDPDLNIPLTGVQVMSSNKHQPKTQIQDSIGHEMLRCAQHDRVPLSPHSLRSGQAPLSP